MIDRQVVVERLNELLRQEASGLLGRVNELHPFADPAAANTLRILDRIAVDEREHRRRLAEEILRAGGVPSPFTHDMSSAGVHYLGVDYLLPMLIDEKRRRISTCERFIAEVDERHACSVVAEILKRHRTHLEQLEAAAAMQSATDEGVVSTAAGDDA